MRRIRAPAAVVGALALVVGLLLVLARPPDSDQTLPSPGAAEPEARPSTPVPTPATASSPAPAQAFASYLRIVRDYADTMIIHGRDTYGPVRSPLFTTTLDRATLGLLKDVPPLPGVRDQDRTINAANPMHDENLYQVLYALTEITDEPSYARAADEALQWFLRHAQSPDTHLLAWGEHLGWDLRAERRTDGSGSARRGDDEDDGDLEGLFRYGTHEYYRPWVLWDRSFALMPQAVTRFARAVWEGHVGDRKGGGYDRHAGYDRPEALTGQEFPRHGGFYIATWAAAYQHTGEREFLLAIAALVGYFERHRDGRSGILVAMSTRPEVAWPFQNLSLSIDLWDAARRLERIDLPAAFRDLPDRMQASAARNDQTILQVARNLPYARHGFARRVEAKTLQPDREEDEAAFTAPWTWSYGHETDAQIAMLCLLRYRQTGQAEYRALALAAADRYLASDPPPSEVLYPGPLGQAISLQVAAYRLTGRPAYLTRADHFTRLAVERFFGSSTLPAASSRSGHYEALTRGDTLAMALLDLWLAANRPRIEPPLIFTDR